MQGLAVCLMILSQKCNDPVVPEFSQRSSAGHWEVLASAQASIFQFISGEGTSFSLPLVP